MNTIVTVPIYIYILLFLLTGSMLLFFARYFYRKYRRRRMAFAKAPNNAIANEEELHYLAIALINGELCKCFSNSLSTGLSKCEIEYIFDCREWIICNRETAISELERLYIEGNRNIYNQVLPFLLGDEDCTKSLNLLEEYKQNDLRIKKSMKFVLNFQSHNDWMRKHPVFRFDRDALERGIIAWDMAEMVLIARMAFDLRYITEDEAWMYIHKAYRKTEDRYADWQQFATGLAIGCAMQSDSSSEFNEFIATAERALTHLNSPWINKNFNPKDKSFILCTRVGVCVICACLFGFTGCKEKGQDTLKKEKDMVLLENNSGFTYPEIPDTLIDPGERGKYLSLHYWDHFDFSDTTYIQKPEITEQIFVDFVDVLHNISQTFAEEGINKLMLRTSQNWGMHNFIIDLFEKYLYDPNSPFRNDELYIPVLEYIINSPIARSEDKITAEYRLKMALKNRVGNQATDFVFASSSGRLRYLSELKNDYILLYFNNPGCEACKQVAAQLSDSSVSKNPGLTVLAIYPDEDLNEWKESQYEIPENWLNGYSPHGEIIKKQLYDLKAIPTLYLLDSEKKVLLKDAPLEQIIAYLDKQLEFSLILQ